VQATTAAAEAERLQRVAAERRGLWLASALALVGLLAFVLLFNFALPAPGAGLGTAARVGLGLVLAAVPAALWLVFFYSLDRAEPEPKRMVFNVLALGALLFAALQPPLLALLGVDEWLYATWWSRLIGGILVVGVIEQTLVWLAVRFAVFDHPEFDERVDGVIYAVAAGLGVATVINFRYVLEYGGVDLDVGSIRVVVNALAHAAFAGVLGYFIGQARFERVPVYYLPAGLGLAALLNGLLFFLLERTPATVLQGQKPWLDLVLAALVAIGALALVFWLIARANEETRRLAQGAALPAPEAAPPTLPGDTGTEGGAA
jgi:RsiW-degrading membrane proteinase PrsW (M82 family)